jgi:predicted esterase
MTMATEKTPIADDRAAAGLLTARPRAPVEINPFVPGLHRLGSGGSRDGLLYVPASYDPGSPAPFLVMLHGAGGIADQVIPIVQDNADRRGVLVLAPESRERRSWDLILGGYGPDVRFIDKALACIFKRSAVRPDRIAIGGFSDGASYALSLALINGLFFRAALAFSPGFTAPTVTQDHPLVYISHGTRDDVLPIERCGRALARMLRQAGYTVIYDEFDGGHIVPAACVENAFVMFLDSA